jgi:hypothetical protein
MLHRAMQRRIAAVALCAAMAGCQDPDPGRPDSGTLFDDAGGMVIAPPAPVLDDVPPRVPWPLVTLRGRALEARRVLVEGGGNPLGTSVLPDDSFCIDVPLPAAADFELSVRSQNDGGARSEAAALVHVTFDPAAPPIPGATTCGGGDPAGCPSATELCENMRDDDCDGLIDDRDPGCATCTDDALEPNDGAGAPRIEPGRYDALRACPADEDWYGVHLEAGETLTAQIYFSHATADLDLHILAADGAVLARSETVTDDEAAMVSATAEGDVWVRVFAAGEPAAGYVLSVAVE